MTRRGIAVIFMAGLLAMPLGLALLIPAVVDWTRLRPEAESLLSAAAGRPVRVSGPIAVRLLPRPLAQLNGLTLGEPALAGADSLRVGLRLLPLLLGRREISELWLTGGRWGPLERIEATITPEGQIQAEGTASLSVLGEARLRFDGATTATGLSGLLRLDAAQATAEGHLTLSPDEAALPDLDITLGAGKATASLVVSLGGFPTQMDLTVKAASLDLDALAAAQPPPAATAVPTAPDTAPPPPPPAPEAATTTPQPQPPPPPPPPGRFALPKGVTANLDLSAERVIWRGLAWERIAVHALLDHQVLTLSQASARLAGLADLALSGTLTAEERQPHFLGRLQAEAVAPRQGRLESLVRLQGETATLAPLTLTLAEDIRATGEIGLTFAAPLGLTAKLAHKGIELGLDSRVEGGGLSGRASLRAASFAQAIRLVSGSYQPRGSGPLDATTQFRTDGKILDLAPLRLKLGDTAVGGTARLDLAAKSVNAALTAPVLALAPFLPAASQPSPLQSWRLDEVSAQLTATELSVTVERLDARMLGGGLTATGRLTPAGAALAATLRGAEMGGLGLGAGGIKATKGVLDGQVRLTGAGSSQAALLASLAGDGRLEVKDGLVEGFDLAAMDAQMRRLENIGSLLGLIQAGLSGGSSRFSSLTASFKAERGIVTSRDIVLVAEGGGAEGTATVDLPKDSIDARLAFRLATPGSPPLGLRLDGRLGAPNKAIDINAMQRYLVEHGLGKALKGKGGGLIESLLGKRRDKSK